MPAEGFIYLDDVEISHVVAMTTEFKTFSSSLFTDVETSRFENEWSRIKLLKNSLINGVIDTAANGAEMYEKKANE